MKFSEKQLNEMNQPGREGVYRALAEEGEIDQLFKLPVRHRTPVFDAIRTRQDIRFEFAVTAKGAVRAEEGLLKLKNSFGGQTSFGADPVALGPRDAIYMYNKYVVGTKGNMGGLLEYKGRVRPEPIKKLKPVKPAKDDK